MTKASLKWEYDYKRSEEERESIDNAMDKLRNDMSVADSKRKELAEQVGNLSRIIRKQTICICETKGTDQLRSNCKADQCLCFLYTDSTMPRLSKSKISSL